MSNSSAVSKQVLDLMRRENRAYSLNDIVGKCDKELGKSTIQKAIDQLVAINEVTLKTFGKTKIYFIKQSNNVAQLKKQLQQTQQELKSAKSSLKTAQINYADVATKLRGSFEQRSLASYELERDKLLDEIREMNEKLRRIENAAAANKISNEEAKQIVKSHEMVRSTYRKRKRICGDMLDAILEGYPKSKKALIEDIGLETDEQAGFQFNSK